jgi:starch phosphorylase
VKAKQDLLDFVHTSSGLQMDIDVLTLGFARRATEYKRATMIFSDLEKLKEVKSQDKIQLIFAGKAHPKDELGKSLIKDIYEFIDRLKGEIEVVYLENYNMEGLTGWAIGPSPDQRLNEQETRKRELSDLYNKLEYLIIPKFYQQRDTWIDLMKNSIGKVAYYFNTHRMMRRYATDAYL